MKIAKKTVDKLLTKNDGVPNKDAPKHKPPPLTLTAEVQSKDKQELRKASQFYLKVNPKSTSKKSSKETYKSSQCITLTGAKHCASQFSGTKTFS
jgi:hypothetical protein